MDFKAIAEAGTAHARAKLANERAYADRAADRLFDEIRTARAHCGNSGALAIATALNLAPLAVALFSHLGCASFTIRALDDCVRLGGLPGPEDMVLDASDNRHPRLLVSSQDRRQHDPMGEMLEPGHIYSVDLTNNLAPIALPFVERDDYPFHPHGLDLVEVNGGQLLYVINHALKNTHSIEVFRVEREQLVFVNRFWTDALISPNDLVALPDGQIYVSNDHLYKGVAALFGDALSFGWSNVVRFHVETGRWIVAADGISLANGVEVRENRLYVAATIDEGIYVYDRDPLSGSIGGPIDFIDVGSGVDNLIWEDEDHLLVAAHPDLFAFLDHLESAENPSPSEVYRVNVRTGNVERVFSDDGRLISASSTAISLENRLYVSQVFEPEIVSCSLSLQ